jgi:large subunit ribosomal protein L19e
MLQKRLAAAIFKCSPQRVRFSIEHQKEIGEAITRADVRTLISQGIITRLAAGGISNGRRKSVMKQLAKGRRRGAGSRKGKANARASGGQDWTTRVRVQRDLLHRLRERKKVSDENYKMLYAKIKGGFFRSERHIKLYMEEQNLFIK